MDGIARLKQQLRESEARNASLEDSCKSLEAEKQEAIEEAEKLRESLAEKEAELQSLLRRMFGPKSERYVDPNQLNLNFGDADQIQDAIDGIEEAMAEQDQEDEEASQRRRRKKRRRKLPESLPRKIVDVDLPDEQKQGKKYIGYDVTETLGYVPAELFVRETRYHKYVTESEPEAGVLQSPREPGIVEGNRYDSGIAAQIIVAKYGYHLPIYRQQDIFASSGWEPSRSTLLNIAMNVALLIRPLIAYFADKVRSDTVVGTDDTGVTLLLPKSIPKVNEADPKSKRVHDVIKEAVKSGKPHVKAKMWAYRGISIPLNVFDFTVSRHRDGPDLFLVEEGYQGTLVGDCFGANTGIEMRSAGDILHGACVAHARRKVNDARDNHPSHARHLLSQFRLLYDIEDRGRQLDDAGRLALRQAESAPVWERIATYLDTQMGDVKPKDKIGEAARYLRNQWSGLTRYLTDGEVPIDNNECEQLMKQVALGRKNWLFIGSVDAGYRAADLLSLVSSAVRNDLDTWAYVKDVLDQLLQGCTDYESLRPDRWAEQHPESIRYYRAEEREDRESRRDKRREARRIEDLG